MKQPVTPCDPLHRSLRRAVRCIGLGGLCLLFSFSLSAQGPPPAPSGDIAKRLEEVDQQLEPLRASLRALGDPTTQATTPETLERQILEREVGLLGRLRRALEDRQRAQDQTRQISEEERQFEDESQTDPIQILGHGAPYSLAELDALLDHRDATAARYTALEQSLQDQRAALEDAVADLRQRDRTMRETQAALADALADAAVALRRELRLKTLAVEVRQQDHDALTLEITNEGRQLDLAKRRQQHLEELARWLRPQLALTDEELQKANAQLDAEASATEAALAHQRLLLENLEMRQDNIQRPEGTEDEVNSVAYEVVKAARNRVELLEHRLERPELRKKAFEIRYKYLRGQLKERQELENSSTVLRGLNGDLERQRRKLESELLDSLASLVTTQTRLQQGTVDGEEGHWLRRLQDELNHLIELSEEDVLDLGQAISRVQRTLESVEQGLGEASFENRLAQAQGLAQDAWGYEFLVVDGNSITVGKVLTAAMFLMLGTWISRRLSRLFARRVLKRFELHEGVVAALQTLSFYLLFLIFFLWALRLVNIPLTAFTFLGGAVAIGVGFGSQNIINNFMSGLILMVERPVKVGDLVDLDGNSGRVEFIGARSTRIRAGDNTHIIVPNSTLLESKVLNWTLSDHLVRTQMEVGVAYGSDVQTVKRQIEKAVSECDRILEHPTPETLFLDFAADALLFRTLFWIEIGQTLDQERACSQLRFRIDENFRKTGITIAFPQRDIHFDQPLEIHMRKADREPRATGRAPEET